jgi:monofunctional biosynthetic peptidoglycan transglycosylase
MLDTPEPRPAVAAAMPPGPRHSVAGRLASSILPCLRTTLVTGSLVLIIALGIPCLVAAAVLFVLRDVNPPGSSLILAQRLSGKTVDQRWVPLQQVSPLLVRAVIASEDNQFCRHHGVDLKELEAVIEAETVGDGASRGGSTITMQVAKNLFLWSSRSYVRKGIEIPLALGIEAIWPKSRIIEVYLNIAEWGPGIFGAEAAAQHYFRKPASRLTEREATLLAVALPNPVLRTPSRPSQHMLKVAGVVERRARLLGTRAACTQR